MFSDLPDVAAAERELRAWADRHGPPGVRVQQRGTRRQHLDLWGVWLAVCGPPTDRPTLRRWLRGDMGRAGDEMSLGSGSEPPHGPGTER